MFYGVQDPCTKTHIQEPCIFRIIIVWGICLSGGFLIQWKKKKKKSLLCFCALCLFIFDIYPAFTYLFGSLDRVCAFFSSYSSLFEWFYYLNVCLHLCKWFRLEWILIFKEIYRVNCSYWIRFIHFFALFQL